MSGALVIPEPSPGLDIIGTCERVVAMAAEIDDVAQIVEGNARLAAWSAYVQNTSTAGLGAIERARRMLEVRIGQLSPRRGAGRPTSDNRPESGQFDRQRTAEFRSMAEHPDEVAEALAGSTDESPATRQKVIDEIARSKALADTPKPKPTPKPKKLRFIETVDILLQPGNIQALAATVNDCLQSGDEGREFLAKLDAECAHISRGIDRARQMIVNETYRDHILGLRVGDEIPWPEEVTS